MSNPTDRLQVHLPPGTGEMLAALEDRLGVPKRYILAHLIRGAHDDGSFNSLVPRVSSDSTSTQAAKDDDLLGGLGL